MDLHPGQPQDLALYSDDEEEEDAKSINLEDGEDTVEEDYGYVNHGSDSESDEWEDAGDESNFQGLDSLGAEDGVDITDLVEGRQCCRPFTTPTPQLPLTS
jgi:hypothetical protein